MLVRFVGDRMTLFSSSFLIKYPWFYSETAFLMSMTSLPSGPGPKGPRNTTPTGRPFTNSGVLSVKLYIYHTVVISITLPRTEVHGKEF